MEQLRRHANHCLLGGIGGAQRCPHTRVRCGTTAKGCCTFPHSSTRPRRSSHRCCSAQAPLHSIGALVTSPSDGAASVLCNIEPGGIVQSAIQQNRPGKCRMHLSKGTLLYSTGGRTCNGTGTVRSCQGGKHTHHESTEHR